MNSVRSSLLAVFAHPDDEAFGAGGTLARCARAGVDVHLVCATRGEAGKITDPEIDAAADLAALREAELREACAVLGAHPPFLLDFHDSGRGERTRHDDPWALMNVDELDLEAALRPHVARVRPDVMLTFDPHGVYGHVDHLRIHRAATAAFWSAGALVERPPRRLFYNVMSSDRMRALQRARPNSPLARLDPGLYGVAESDLAAVIEVGDLVDTKERAMRAHRSQLGPRSSFAGADEGPGSEAWQEMMQRETFTLGGLRGAFPDPPIDDLFAGLD